MRSDHQVRGDSQTTPLAKKTAKSSDKANGLLPRPGSQKSFYPTSPATG
jgi:hypothetical protein